MIEHAYIHIPFCKKKCKYCAFVSYSRPELIQVYCEELIQDVKRLYNNDKLKTLYIGGGTPSLLKSTYIQDIISVFNFADNPEITMEVNPETVDIGYLKQIKDAGVNRISIGVQSFDDTILNSIGRIHDSKRAKDTVLDALNAGFKNISADFIYGLPAQSIEGFISDLKTALSLGVSHISLYGLKIEEETEFFKNPPPCLPDDDEQAKMYLAAINTLEDNGFLHYEISNFSKPGCQSRHNLAYWKNKEYYGFGVSAHGYENRIRYSNVKTLDQYIKMSGAAQLFNNSSGDDIKYQKKHDEEHFVTDEELIEEEIFLGLRTVEGINLAEFKHKFGVDFLDKYRNVIEKYRDFFIITDDFCSLSNNGFLLSTPILAEFIGL